MDNAEEKDGMHKTIKEDGTSSLRKAIRVLKCFDEERKEFSMTEIAQKLDFPTGTASRILNALLEEKLLERNERTKLYSLGLYCLRLGKLAERSGILRVYAYPLMEELRNHFNETVNLYIREGFFRVCYAQRETFSPLKRTVPLGGRFPLWAGAAGRCILAWQTQSFIELVLNEIAPITENTITDKVAVLKLLERVKSDGYSTSVAERELGVAAVAVPIFDSPDSVFASMSISGPQSRFTEDLVEEMVVAMKNASQKLSRILQERF